MSEKDQQDKITGHEGEPGSFIVVNGQRQPNPDGARVTLTPDDQGYHEAKRRLGTTTPSAKPQPSTPPALPAAADKIGGK